MEEAGAHVCLLIVLSRVQPEFPLVVGANRDELYERRASPMTVLRQSSPRVLGGRDELAGGTWLAVSDAGVVAGVTNSPTSGGRDLTKRSRGELPLLLAEHGSAAAAVEHLLTSVDPRDYNPAWILVGDRTSLYFLDMGDGSSLRIRALPAGLHVLENRPLEAASAKARRARRVLGAVGGQPLSTLERRLSTALRDHEGGDAGAPGRPHEASPVGVNAACVHSERYGTRWSGVVTVPASPDGPPRVRYTDGAPCRSPYRDARWG